MSNVIFLDRDGTIIKDKHYLCEPQGVELIPKATQALRLLQDAHYKLVLISNQSGIGRGKYNLESMQAVNQRLLDLLHMENIRLNAIYCCPHTPEDNCTCRKPKIGLINQALTEHNYNLENAFVIGDKDCDVQLGLNVGIKSILVRTGYGLKASQETILKAHYVANDLYDAAKYIVNQS